MKLREYQQTLVDNIKLSFAAKLRRVIMCAPTGSGKTVMFTYIAKQTLQKRNKVLVITDRKELLRQSGSTFESFGINPEYLTAKTGNHESGSCVVAMVETLKRRLTKPDYIAFLQDFNLIIIDECHKVTFDKIFTSLLPNQYVIGATATPERKNGELSKYYDIICNTITVRQLIKLNFLTPAKYFGINLDFKEVNLKGDDFDPDEIQKYYQKNKVFEGVIKNYLKHANREKALLFCANIATSLEMCKKLNEAGITSKHLDAKSKDRDLILDAFDKNEFQVLCNVGILTTGYDAPSVKCIILYRATLSLPLYLQMCGRGSRIFDGKTHFTILDFGGNIQRHDFWELDRTWGLIHKKKKSKVGEIVMKNCPRCDAFIYATAKNCGYCDFQYPSKTCSVCKLENSGELEYCENCGEKIEFSLQQKISIDLEEIKPCEVRNFALGKSIPELEAIRIEKGYKLGWLLRQLDSLEKYKDYGYFKGYANGWAFYQWSHRKR